MPEKKYVVDLNKEQFIDWAIRFIFNKLMASGLKGFKEAITIVIEQASKIKKS